MRRRLIVTADDFGMAPEVNEAVEAAHRDGVLTGASLLITGAAAPAAVALAKRTPTLEVGLHLAMVAAPPAADPADIPDLLAADGSGLGQRPIVTGARAAMSRRVRAQVRRELVAQFEAFRRAGLRPSHVDGHWHGHQHPDIVRLIVELAPEYGVRTVRWPREPVLASARAARGEVFVGRAIDAALHAPILRAMRARLRRAGIATNDWFYGKTDGGRLTADRLGRIVSRLSPGVSEIGLHPASRRWTGPHAPPADWRMTEELEALTSPALRDTISRHGVRLVCFSDLAA